MATSDSFNTTSVGNFYFTVLWRRTGYDSTRNEHYIDYSVVAHNTPGSYRTVYNKSLVINGNTVYSAPGGTQYHDGDIVTTGSITVHSYNDAGNGSLSVSFSAGVGTTSGTNVSGSGNWELDQIPRYANFTEHYIASTGLNSITVHWWADSVCDWAKYSLNGGPWIDVGDTTYTITGLAPNTTYSIRTAIRRKDSQLWTESGTIYGTTKDIAKITSAPNINLGDNATVSISNPSGSNIMLFVNTLNPEERVLERNAFEGNNTIIFTDSELDMIYKKMGKGNSTTFRFLVLTNGQYWDWQDRTCTLTGNQKTIKTKVNSEWKRGKAHVKVSGNWKRGVVWTKVNGIWERSI